MEVDQAENMEIHEESVTPKDGVKCVLTIKLILVFAFPLSVNQIE